MRPIYIAPHEGLQGAAAHSAATARNTSTYLLLERSETGFFYVHYTTHKTNGFMSHPKNNNSAISAGS